MSKLITANALLGRLCQGLGMLIIMSMMIVTITDIVTRSLYDWTSGAFPWFMKGSVELVSYGLLLAILAGFAGLVEQSQIIVDVLSERFSACTQQILASIMLMIYALIGLVMSIGLISNLFLAMEYGDMTQDLRIPLVYIYACAVLFTLVLTLRSALEAVIVLLSPPNTINQCVDF